MCFHQIHLQHSLTLSWSTLPPSHHQVFFSFFLITNGLLLFGWLVCDMHGCHAYMYASVLWVCLVLGEARRGLWVPGTGVRDTFEPVSFLFFVFW